jgi:leader peptidase (prepilin peptidase)/N-methyltransferase
MMPVASWLLLRARCRYCRQRISPYYPAVELATLAVSLSAILTTTGTVEWVTIALGWVLVALAAMDLRHMVLSDSLTIGLVVCGLVSAGLWSQFALTDHLLGALIGGAALYCINLIYRLLRHQDGLGMGDVKLFAAAGAWLAWQNLPSVLLYATFTALAAVLAYRSIVAPSERGPIPLGAFICLGFWLTWLYGPIDMWSS